MKPTNFIERRDFQFLDYSITQHDLGGQKKYLIKYLKQPDKFFDNTDICVYVIDIQDLGRYNETLEYAREVLEQFEQLGITPKIYVFFHKAENILLEGNLEFAKHVEMLTEKILDFNDNRFFIDFETTTIYDNWTITSAFSAIFEDIYPKNEMVGKIMEDLSLRLHVKAIALLDKHLLTLANYSSPGDMKDLLLFCTSHLFTIHNSMKTFPKFKREKLSLSLDRYRVVFIMNNKTDPVTYLSIIGEKDMMIKEDEIEQEISYLLPELYAILNIKVK